MNKKRDTRKGCRGVGRGGVGLFTPSCRCQGPCPPAAAAAAPGPMTRTESASYSRRSRKNKSKCYCMKGKTDVLERKKKIY